MITINVVLCLLLIHICGSLLTKSRFNILSCGLFAWSSDSAKNWTELNKFKFEILGVENDVRGGDGCGIFYDNTIVKSESVKKFDDFWRGKNVPDELEHPCIIGHDRKSSVGGNTYENTQPIAHKGISTVIAHNGTLVNHLELFTKYDILKDHPELKTTGMSDSQMLCLLIHYKGWKILDEYIGAAALVISKNDESNKMYIYHGKSPMRKHATVDSEERPLYYAIDGDSFWVSSTQSSLARIVHDRSKITEVPFNKVFEVEGTAMREVYSAKRGACYQLDYATSNYYENFTSKKESACNTQMAHSGSTHSAKPNLSIKDDKDTSEVPGFIYYEGGTWRGKQITPGVASEQLDGQVFVTNWAKYMSPGENGVHRGSFRVLYFWRGNLCKGRKAYLECLKNEAELSHLWQSPMLYYINGSNFLYPFIIPTANYGDGETMYSAKETIESGFRSKNNKVYPLNNIKFTGAYSVPCRRVEFVFSNGKLESKQYSSAPYSTFASTMFNEIDDADYSTYIEECETMFESISNESDVIVKHVPKKEKEEDLVKYACPSCSVAASTLDPCPFCGNTGVVTKSQMIEYLDEFVNEEIDTLGCRGDILIIQDNLLDVIGDAVSQMEEPDMKDINDDFYKLLLETKTNIEKCIQS